MLLGDEFTVGEVGIRLAPKPNKQAFGIFGFNTHTDLKDSKVLLFLGARHACLVVLFCLDIDVEHFWTSNYTVNF